MTLAEIEASLGIDQETIIHATKDWKQAVIKKINFFGNNNLSFYDEPNDPDSTISIRI